MADANNMAKQGKHHMGGTKRYVKNMINIPASRVDIKEAFPNIPKPKVKHAITSMADQPTRKMLGIKIVKGGK